MKRTLLSLVLILVYAISVFAAASSITQALHKQGENVRVLEISWTGCSYGTGCTTSGDVTSVSVDSTIGADLNGWYITHVITKPGPTTLPTLSYDVTLVDAASMDVMGGTTQNRNSSLTESAVPKIDTTNSIYGNRLWNGTHTIKISGNSVNAATGKVLIFLKREK